MISFLIAVALLVVGYIFYGKVVTKNFGPDERQTPAVRINDGVDYIPMPTWKVFLIRLLNIAGTCPIFGIFLIVMAFGVAASMMFSGRFEMPEVWEHMENMQQAEQASSSSPRSVSHAAAPYISGTTSRLHHVTAELS